MKDCLDCIYRGKVELGKVYCTKWGWEVEPTFDPQGRVIGFTEADECDFYRRRKEE